MTEALSKQGAEEFSMPTIKRTLEHYALVQEVMHHIMKENTHYGASFPGDIKKNLLKPGADALCLAFHFVPEFGVTEHDLGNGHREYRTDCTIKTQNSQILIASGVGTCSTMESKYRYRNASLKCPVCGKEAVIKGKPEYEKEEKYKGGWLCYAKKGGCGTKWPKGAIEIEGQEQGKIENSDPADIWNTVLKISKKRAFVDAIITATAASDMFTQDLEEMEEALRNQPHQAKPSEQSKSPATEASAQSVPAASMPSPEPASSKPESLTDQEWEERIEFCSKVIANCKTAEDIAQVYDEFKRSAKTIPNLVIKKMYEIKKARVQAIQGGK